MKTKASRNLFSDPRLPGFGIPHKPEQHYEILHPSLGPYTQGDVVQIHLDIHAALPGTTLDQHAFRICKLLDLKAITPTSKPLYRKPQLAAKKPTITIKAGTLETVEPLVKQ